MRPSLVTINQKIWLWAMGLCRWPPPPLNVGKSDGSTSDFFLGPRLGLVDFNFEGGVRKKQRPGSLDDFLVNCDRGGSI